MKKIFTLILACAGLTFAQAQSTRMVLIEEATNASCGPCASQNPAFHTLLNANTSNVTSIKYQVWWPGYDPMYEHNEADVDIRVPYYNVTGAPTAIIDGVTPGAGYTGFNTQWYNGAPGGVTQSSLNYATGIPASFDIEISYDITPVGISINAIATCTQDVSGDLRLHIVVIEEEINFDVAPGSNGETEFYNVMKKMLPSAQGSSMESSYEVGDSFAASETWTFANVYDVEEIAVVAFVQNASTKAIHQAAFANNVSLEPAFTIDAGPISISGIDDYICENTVSPSVEIRNFGGDDLTSATITYELNDVTESIEWTGSLGFYETETVELGDITFTPGSSNDLVVTLSNPNGADDENSDNDESEVSIFVAEESTTLVTVTLELDSYPEETEWEIIDDEGDVIEDGGPYNGMGGQTIEVDVEIPSLGCYAFRITDTYGDGLNGGAWTGGYNGNYTVTSSDGNVVASGGGNEQWSEELTGIKVSSEAVSTNNFDFKGSVNIFPNPSSGSINVDLTIEESQSVTLEIFDLVGKRVAGKDFGTLAPGNVMEQIDLSDLKAGIYFVNFNSGNARLVKKITITK